MREIACNEITAAVAALCGKANRQLPSDIGDALSAAAATEPWPLAKEILSELCKNAQVATQHALPICQDTGMVCVFLEVGQALSITGGLLSDAVNAGVRQGYQQYLLRKSVVGDPLRRENTGDNTPAVIHYDIVPGDRLQITLLPKGFGSENMSRIAMLKPADGVEGVINFVTETVTMGGSKPCPPIVVGVGLGGTFEYAALLAKKALSLPINAHHPDPYYSDLEERLLRAVNNTGVGPQGFGGKTTALGLRLLTYPTHIAGLPVAVNISCHVTRHQSITL